MEHATDPAAEPPPASDTTTVSDATTGAHAARDAAPKPDAAAPRPVEIGGPKGPEPTRYGDWERKGRCYDF